MGLTIWWLQLSKRAKFIKILLDPDHLGHIEPKSSKIGGLRIFSPFAQIWPLLEMNMNEMNKINLSLILSPISRFRCYIFNGKSECRKIILTDKNFQRQVIHKLRQK